MSNFPLNSYQVGILCALPLEKAAVEAALDEEHERPEGIPKQDEHSYTFGRIGAHRVVIACLPDGMTGKASAATVGTKVTRTFPIKVGLMVGIGGGAPSRSNDIRLGDVVVGRPQGTHGGVVQYYFGKELPNGFARTGILNKPPTTLLSALAGLRTKHERPKWNKVSTHLADIIEEMGERYEFQGAENDVLFDSTYDHIGGPEVACDDTDELAHCDLDKVVRRPDRKDPTRPVIHYGIIASADKVMRHAPERDRIARELGALCFEIEAAGLEENFRCIVIRGICDYSDSHKNKRWQRYAAATAAAFAKEFLGFVLPQGLDELGAVRDSEQKADPQDSMAPKAALPTPSSTYRCTKPIALASRPHTSYQILFTSVSRAYQSSTTLCPGTRKWNDFSRNFSRRKVAMEDIARSSWCMAWAALARPSSVRSLIIQHVLKASTDMLRCRIRSTGHVEL